MSHLYFGTTLPWHLLTHVSIFVMSNHLLLMLSGPPQASPMWQHHRLTLVQII